MPATAQTGGGHSCLWGEREAEVGTITPEIPTERVAIIVFLLCKGRTFTTDEIAELCGVTKRGAYYIMSRISRVLPLALDNGTWTEFHPAPDENEQDVHSVMLQ